ncbi:3-phosphoshikimate 1-carboxyvinyltransferase [candidate division KSB1 bacterium]|nr:3-phosphoshikimate 1-carboxyvinyltransferase [candidate division KSB1 bacterium]
MAEKTLSPSRFLSGTVSLPGDKSISHRALLLAGIASGESCISGISTSEDVLSTISCLRKLGVKIKRSKTDVVVQGVGREGLKQPRSKLDAGNSGTTMRLLTGILSAQTFISTIDGDESLRKRPMRRIIDPLEQMGAQIENNNYRAPLKIIGRPLRAIDYASPIASAQVKSAIILAGLYARGITRVTERSASRDHTERMLGEFGVKAQYSMGGAGVKGPADLQACDIDIPRDISAAAFFLVAACLLPDSEIEITNVGTNPTRIGVLDALSSMGARIKKSREKVINNEPRTDLIAKSSSLHQTTLQGSIISNIIDEIPILSIAATQAEGTTIIRDAQELRVKESDRIKAIVSNLKKMNANVKESKDGLLITGPTPLTGATIDSYGDHRIAMSFAIAGLIADGKTVIKGAECVDISFPGFFDILDEIRND